MAMWRRNPGRVDVCAGGVGSARPVDVEHMGKGMASGMGKSRPCSLPAGGSASGDEALDRGAVAENERCCGGVSDMSDWVVAAAFSGASRDIPYSSFNVFGLNPGVGMPTALASTKGWECRRLVIIST